MDPESDKGARYWTVSNTFNTLRFIDTLPELGISRRELKMRLASSGCKIRVVKDRVEYVITERTPLKALYWIFKHHDVLSVDFVYGKRHWQDCIEISLHRNLDEAICS